MRSRTLKHLFRLFLPLSPLSCLIRSIRSSETPVGKPSGKQQYIYIYIIYIYIYICIYVYTHTYLSIVLGPLYLTGLQQQARSHALPYSWCPELNMKPEVSPEFPQQYMSHSRRQCLDSPYGLLHAGGENLTREPKPKSDSKHFRRHCMKTRGCRV